MKILIPAHEGRDNFAQNVARTLRTMGHEVLTAPPKVDGSRFARFGRAWAEVKGRAGLSEVTPAERWAVRASQQFQPYLVLALTQQLSAATLTHLKKSGVRCCAAWWGDSPANMKRWGLLTPGWDALFLKDGDAVAKFRRAGSNAYHLHEAMNPEWHKPMASRTNQAIVVAGHWYAFRQALVARLMKSGIEIRAFGARPPYWALPEIKQLHTGKYVTGEEKSQVFGEGLGCLNSMHLSEGNSLNCRAFEIAGAAGLQFIEHRPAIEECFEPGRELLVFKTFEELIEQISWARASTREAAIIRAAGARRAAADHTYEQRLLRLLRVVREV